MMQAVAAIAVTLIAVALLTAMSMRADRRFDTQRRLPMQWWLDGSVTWTAPRPVALAFTPVLASACLAVAIFAEPRPGQEHLVLPVQVFGALFFLGFHALHLWLIQRTLRRQR